jgi:transcriptional regulator with XRE-family HTH domain
MNNYTFNPFDFGPAPLLTMEKVRDQMRVRRKWLGWTQKELARRSGVSYGSIKRFETKCEISFHSLVKLAFYLDCLDGVDNLFLPKEFKTKEEADFYLEHLK